VPTKDGWNVSEMPTYSPVALAGNNPRLPEDTLSRTLRVILLPDLSGQVQESNWELLDADARALGQGLAAWAESVRDAVRTNRPPLPPGITGRARERWSPLMRVAVAAGGRWPAVVEGLALDDREQQEMNREDGMVRDRPAVLLLTHLHEGWTAEEPFLPTARLIDGLVHDHPDTWGDASPLGKRLTAQRLGRMLATGFGINSTRLDRTGPRGYSRAALLPVWYRMGVRTDPRRLAPVHPPPPKETGATGSTGSTGATRAADLGPCRRGCGRQTTVYGPTASPFCATCRTEQQVAI